MKQNNLGQLKAALIFLMGVSFGASSLAVYDYVRKDFYTWFVVDCGDAYEHVRSQKELEEGFRCDKSDFSTTKIKDHSFSKEMALYEAKRLYKYLTQGSEAK